MRNVVSVVARVEAVPVKFWIVGTSDSSIRLLVKYSSIPHYDVSSMHDVSSSNLYPTWDHKEYNGSSTSH